MIVVSDTSSLNYLILIDHLDLLPRLYQRVFIPRAVSIELSVPETPARVKKWAENLPGWVEVLEIMNVDPSLFYLDRGEQEGIALAQAIHADLMLLDDGAARKAAEARSIMVTGTLGVLRLAAAQGWIDLDAAIEKLQRTNFRASASVIARVRAQDYE